MVVYTEIHQIHKCQCTYGLTCFNSCQVNWSEALERLSEEGVHLVNATKACRGLMSEIVEKTFNAKVSACIKRYHSMFLARGGAKASRSSIREVRKQEGLGKMSKTGPSVQT